MKNRRFEFVNNKKYEDAFHKLPERATKSSAAYDLYSPIDVIINPGKSKMIWTDVRAIFPDDEMLIVNVRSSMGKYNIMLANTAGWIDSDYCNADNEGNIGINLYNYGNMIYSIKAGDRIGQAAFVKLAFCDDEPESERTGGFGSTGL